LRPGTDAWRLHGVLDRLTVIAGSLDDIEELRAPLALFRPDAVAHMAWRGVGNMDRNSPVQAHNIPDALDLAALAFDVGAAAFVGAGSQAEYGPYDRIIREDDTPRPTTLYGKAKLAAGSMTGQLAADHAGRFAWLRIFSTYGPKDADYWLIPSFIMTLRRGRRMVLTACEQRWSFLHARDAAAAFRIVLATPTAEGLFNLGCPQAPALRDTVLALRDLVSPGTELGFGEISYRPDQVMILTSRLAALGWRPQVGLDEGLRETVAWYAG
jgi:UDP-glucose 4-epimerase